MCCVVRFVQKMLDQMPFVYILLVQSAGCLLVGNWTCRFSPLFFSFNISASALQMPTELSVDRNKKKAHRLYLVTVASIPILSKGSYTCKGTKRIQYLR